LALAPGVSFITYYGPSGCHNECVLTAKKTKQKITFGPKVSASPTVDGLLAALGEVRRARERVAAVVTHGVRGLSLHDSLYMRVREGANKLARRATINFGV
jgi:hypothetical protein